LKIQRSRPKTIAKVFFDAGLKNWTNDKQFLPQEFLSSEEEEEEKKISLREYGKNSPLNKKSKNDQPFRRPNQTNFKKI